MLRSKISSWREYLTPVNHKSTFDRNGEISPDEFVKAGDYLCHMFPTWQWNEVGDQIQYRDFLPKDKQFLVSRKVPCARRAQDITGLNVGQEVEMFNDDEEPFVAKREIDHEERGIQTGIEEPQDIDDLLQEMELQDDEVQDFDSNVIDVKVDSKMRYYDLYIAYSTSYRVPKMYIAGFNSDGAPLNSEQMFEDIAPDYRAKTATIEKLSFYKSPVFSVSIHPCKHANVMRLLLDKIRAVKERRRQELKKIGQSVVNDEDWEDIQDEVDETFKVDLYLVVFLKFITSVTPSIEHDYTMEGW